MSYTIIVLCIVALEILRRICVSIYAAFFTPLSKVPGPLSLKLCGSIWLYHTLRGETMNIAPKLFKKYGDVVRIGPNEIMVSSKSAIQKIIVEDDFKKSPLYTLTQEDQHRRPLSAGFSISFLNAMEPLMKSCVDFMVEILESRCITNTESEDGRAVVDMFCMLGNLTMDVMSATLFGGSFGLVINEDPHVKNLFLDRLRRVYIDVILPFVKYIPFIPSPVQEMDRMIDGIIKTRRAEMRREKKDLLQIFLDANESDPTGFTDKHLMEEMRLFMIAGSDTTGTTCTFTLLLLLNNPSKLHLLTQEILSAFPSKHDTITFANTQDLPYLNAAINESMRLMPMVVSGLPRYTSETNWMDGFEIPAHVTTYAFPNILQVDPRIWPDADSYIPERWLDNYKGVPVDKKAFLPFSGGVRNCIGQQFALREIRLILATVLRRFELDLIPGQSHELRVHAVPYFKEGKYLMGVKVRRE
ncbi:p450 monooxygenase [Botrytis cinerea]